AGLGGGEGSGKGVVFQAKGRPVGHLGAQLQQHAAGAATGVEHRTEDRGVGERTAEKLRDQRTQAAIPPHAVLELVHALVFSPLHALRPLPASVFFPPAYDIFILPCQPSRPSPRSFRRVSNGCCWCRCLPCPSCGWPATSSRP